MTNEEEKMWELTPEEKKSSLEAPFWSVDEEIDRNTPFMKKIHKLWEELEEEQKENNNQE